MTHESSYLASDPMNISIRLGSSGGMHKLEQYLPLLHTEPGEKFAVLNNSYYS